MKKLRVLLIIFNSSFLFSQAPLIQWQKSLGGTSFERANKVIQTSSGEYIVAGYTTSSDGDVTGYLAGNDCWIVKLNASGTILWKKILGGTGNEGITSVQQTSDGGYIVAASSTSLDGDITGNHGGADIWIIKLDSLGAIVWQKAFGGTSNESAGSIKQTSDGGYIVAGSSSSFNGDVTGNHGGGDAWVLKIDSQGILLWQKTLGGNGLDFADDVEPTADGGYIVCASAELNNGDVTGVHGLTDYWIVKLNSLGVIVWQKALGGTGSERCYEVKQTLDGGYIVCGSATSNNGDVTGSHGSNDSWIVKLNASGALVWQKAIGGTGIDLARSMYQNSDSSYIIVGYSASNDGDVTGNHGDKDAWLTKLSSAGVLLWQKCYGGTLVEEAFSISQTSDGYGVLSGNASSNDGDVSGNHGGADFWVAKLGPSTLATDDFSSNRIKIFPNPTNDSLTLAVDYYLPSFEISITDIAGKTILKQKLDGLTTTLNIEKLSTGTYFLILSADDQVKTQKFIKQ